MALNVKDEEAVRLAGEVAKLTGESKTRAIRVALEERLERLVGEQEWRRRKRSDWLAEFLEKEAWPSLREGERGRIMSKEEREKILGYGPEGV